MKDAVSIRLVMVRGPALLPRYLDIPLTTDGTPTTLGRSLRCGVVLDPLLMFASQVQCGISCIVNSSAAPVRREATTGDSVGKSGMDASMHTPVHQQLLLHDTTDHKDDDNNNNSSSGGDRDGNGREETGKSREWAGQGREDSSALPDGAQLYMMDMCSSNGTFVNHTRISATDLTPLHDGDLCILGGMRDVGVGAALPSDAFDGPELIVWCVDTQTRCLSEAAQTTVYPNVRMVSAATMQTQSAKQQRVREGREAQDLLLCHTASEAARLGSGGTAEHACSDAGNVLAHASERGDCRANSADDNARWHSSSRLSRQPRVYALEETPMVVPLDEALEKEERALLCTAQRALHLSGTSSRTTRHEDGNGGGDKSEEVSASSEGGEVSRSGARAPDTRKSPWMLLASSSDRNETGGDRVKAQGQRPTVELKTTGRVHAAAIAASSVDMHVSPSTRVSHDNTPCMQLSLPPVADDTSIAWSKAGHGGHEQRVVQEEKEMGRSASKSAYTIAESNNCNHNSITDDDEDDDATVLSVMQTCRASLPDRRARADAHERESLCGNKLPHVDGQTTTTTATATGDAAARTALSEQKENQRKQDVDDVHETNEAVSLQHTQQRCAHDSSGFDPPANVRLALPLPLARVPLDMSRSEITRSKSRNTSSCTTALPPSVAFSSMRVGRCKFAAAAVASSSVHATTNATQQDAPNALSCAAEVCLAAGASPSIKPITAESEHGANRVVDVVLKSGENNNSDDGCGNDDDAVTGRTCTPEAKAVRTSLRVRRKRRRHAPWTSRRRVRASLAIAGSQASSLCTLSRSPREEHEQEQQGQKHAQSCVTLMRRSTSEAAVALSCTPEPASLSRQNARGRSDGRSNNSGLNTSKSSNTCKRSQTWARRRRCTSKRGSSCSSSCSSRSNSREHADVADRKTSTATALVPDAPVHAVSSPYRLTITTTHWKWAMDDPNTFVTERNAQFITQNISSSCDTAAARERVGDAKSECVGAEGNALMPSVPTASLFLCMLPVTSLASVFACVERLGVSVELREGCHIPRVRREITSGEGLRNRWVVWKLETTQFMHGAGESTHDRFYQWLHQLNTFCVSLSAPPVHVISAEVFDQLYDPPPSEVA